MATVLIQIFEEELWRLNIIDYLVKSFAQYVSKCFLNKLLVLSITWMMVYMSVESQTHFTLQVSPSILASLFGPPFPLSTVATYTQTLYFLPELKVFLSWYIFLLNMFFSIYLLLDLCCISSKYHPVFFCIRITSLATSLTFLKPEVPYFSGFESYLYVL